MSKRSRHRRPPLRRMTWQDKLLALWLWLAVAAWGATARVDPPPPHADQTRRAQHLEPRPPTD